MLDLLGAPCLHVEGTAGEQGGRVAMDSRALRRCLAKDCEPDQQATYLTKRRLCPAFYVKAELLNSWIQVLYIIYINIHIIYIYTYYIYIIIYILYII